MNDSSEGHTACAPLSDDLLQRTHAWWRAANYLSVGQIYLLDNPLLRDPLAPTHVKPRLLGHWGTTTTPFDMTVLNRLDRFHLCEAVIDRVGSLSAVAVYAKQAIRDKLVEHRRYVDTHGNDLPEVRDWRWPAARPGQMDEL